MKEDKKKKIAFHPTARLHLAFRRKRRKALTAARLHQECVFLNENFPEINRVSPARGEENVLSFSQSQHFSAPLTSHCSVILEMKTATLFSALPALQYNKTLSRTDAISSVCDKSLCDRLQLRLNIMLQASKRDPLSPRAPHNMQRR